MVYNITLLPNMVRALQKNVAKKGQMYFFFRNLEEVDQVSEYLYINK